MSSLMSETVAATDTAVSESPAPTHLDAVNKAVRLLLWPKGHKYAKKYRQNSLPFIEQLPDNVLRAAYDYLTEYSEDEKEIVRQAVVAAMSGYKSLNRGNGNARRISYAVALAPLLVAFGVDESKSQNVHQAISTRYKPSNKMLVDEAERTTAVGFALNEIVFGDIGDKLHQAHEYGTDIQYYMDNAETIMKYRDVIAERRIINREIIEELKTTASPSLSQGVL